jgi:hypothetical protein
VSVAVNKAGISGLLVVELVGPDGEVKSLREYKNLITEVGDRYYAERAAGVSGAPAVATGMQLGTSTTAPAKSGTGSSIVTLIASSLVALNPTVPTSALSAGARRLGYSCSWAAGVATNATINEIALVNQAVATQTVAPAANTIARALISVNKGASDVLNVTWYHDLLGA